MFAGLLQLSGRAPLFDLGRRTCLLRLDLPMLCHQLCLSVAYGFIHPLPVGTRCQEIRVDKLDALWDESMGSANECQPHFTGHDGESALARQQRMVETAIESDIFFYCSHQFFLCVRQS